VLCVREQIQQLHALQQTDTRIARAKAELAELDHGAALKKQTRVAKAEFDELEAKLRSRRTDQRDAELELKKIEDTDGADCSSQEGDPAARQAIQVNGVGARGAADAARGRNRSTPG